MPGKHNAGCLCCDEGPDDCSDCTAGTTPTTWTVVIADIADDTCGDCTDYNGTYTPTQQTACQWGIYTGHNICSLGAMNVRLTVSGYLIKVELYVGLITYLEFRKTRSDFDCDVTNLDIPLYADSFGSICDGSSATCTLTGNGPYT
jgi:hypothetical protein